jgi:hypothetical protein
MADPSHPLTSTPSGVVNCASRSKKEASMRLTALYRIAGVLLIVCAALNAYGLSRFWRVAGSMNPVSFPVGHRPLTYAQVVLGLGLFWSVCFLFGAYLAWHLGTLARKTPQATGALGWGLFAYEVVGIVISWIALAGLAHVVLIATVLCIGWATWLSFRECRSTNLRY